MFKTIPLHEAEGKFKTLINNTQKGVDEYVITVNGKAAAKIVSMGEDEELTKEFTADAELMKDVKEAEEDFKHGRFVDWDDLKKELKL